MLAVYLGAAWVVLQVSYVLQDAAGLPGWVPPFAVLLLLIRLVGPRPRLRAPISGDAAA